MEFSKRLDRQFFGTVLVNVIGTLLAVMLARKLSGNNGYLYVLIGFALVYCPIYIRSH